MVAAIAGGVVSLLIAVAVERRAPDLILDPALFRSRVIASANASYVLCMLALFAVSFLMPFYFEDLRGFGVEKSGLLLTPFAHTLGTVAPLSGALSDRVGSRCLAPAGLTIAAVGLVLLSFVGADTSTSDIIWRLAITGIGQGIFQSPNTRTLMGAAPAEKQGVASAILSTGRVIGQALSVAVSEAVFAALGGAEVGSMLIALRGQVPPTAFHPLQDQSLRGFHVAMLCSAVLALAGAIAALDRQ